MLRWLWLLTAFRWTSWCWCWRGCWFACCHIPKMICTFKFFSLQMNVFHVLNLSLSQYTPPCSHADSGVVKVAGPWFFCCCWAQFSRKLARLHEYSYLGPLLTYDYSYCSWHNRAGASYFRLVRPLRAHVNKLGEVWRHAPQGKLHSEIASEAIFGPKMLLESRHL